MEEGDGDKVGEKVEKKERAKEPGPIIRPRRESSPTTYIKVSPEVSAAGRRITAAKERKKEKR